MVAGAPHTRRGFPSSSREAPRAMFEESEWDWDEAAPPAPEQQQQQQLQAPRLPRGPAAGGGAGRRRHLLATLRRLEGSASHRPPSASSSGGSDQEEEEGVAGDLEAERRGKKRRRTRRREKKDAAEHLGLPGYPEEKRRRGDCGGAAAVVAGTDGASARPHSSPKGPGAEEGPAEEGVGQPLLTRKQWRNRQKNKRRQKNKFKALGGLPAARQMPEDAHSHTTTAGEPAGSPETGGPTPAEPLGGRAASLRLRMAERLEAARFRHLNQQLYSRPSWEAAPLFQQDPEAFAAYHRGFAQQMARWPEKPVQRIVRYLRHRPASLIVADFGCGDCTLARSLRNKVHCFDLVALDPRVTACDMAQVPLEAESVDVAVFCLALMGTNVQEILGEASRVLRMGGTLLVAEVASRFPDVRAFVGALARLGFALRSKDLSGSHFYTFEFAKVAVVPGKAKPLPGLALRPCLYKRR